MYPQGKVVSNDTFRIFLSGNANLVSFVDYLAGRKLGIYWPVLPPIYQKKTNDTTNKTRIDYMNIMTEEFWRQCIRQKMGTPNLINKSNLFQKFFGAVQLYG
jgi:hypothetical protein